MVPRQQPERGRAGAGAVVDAVAVERPPVQREAAACGFVGADFVLVIGAAVKK